jgi:hypothetical protein
MTSPPPSFRLVVCGAAPIVEGPPPASAPQTCGKYGWFAPPNVLAGYSPPPSIVSLVAGVESGKRSSLPPRTAPQPQLPLCAAAPHPDRAHLSLGQRCTGAGLTLLEGPYRGHSGSAGDPLLRDAVCNPRSCSVGCLLPRSDRRKDVEGRQYGSSPPPVLVWAPVVTGYFTP